MENSRISAAPIVRHPIIEFTRQIFVFPPWQDVLFALLSAVLLILAFPDFELWFLAWFALVPLMLAVERNKSSAAKSFWLGLITGSVFYLGSCWWLTYAPIRYGGLPAPLIYLLFIPVTIAAGFFTAIFAAILARLLSKFGQLAIFLTPFVWTACELARYWLTGNAWNALGYSQAFNSHEIIKWTQIGGVFIVSFQVVLITSFLYFIFRQMPYFIPFFSHYYWFRSITKEENPKAWQRNFVILFLLCISFFLVKTIISFFLIQSEIVKSMPSAVVVALQPNVPMSGLTHEKYLALRRQHVEMAEAALNEIEDKSELIDLPKIVVFPESPMSFQYAQDSEFREFVVAFNQRNRVSLIFNGWEPTPSGDGLTNSAVMINERGEKIAQYDKIRLVPFGEYIPQWIPFSNLMPTVVGRSTPGKNTSLMGFGSSVRAGVMICYESAFGDISGQFVQNGADVLVELTNDGYSGETPILRQHLAHAVFRAVETNRPLLRVTNVGISAYINERGRVSETTESYKAATRIWTVAKSDGRETFYVRNGDLFAWICAGLTAIFFGLTFLNLRKTSNQ